MPDNNKEQKPANPDFPTALAQLEEALPVFGPLMTDIDVAFCDHMPGWGLLSSLAPTDSCQVRRDLAENRGK